MKLQTGDILLHKGNRWTSRAIRWVTGSPYTHVAIVFDEKRVFEIDINKCLSIYELDTSLSYEVYRYNEGLSDEMKRTLKAKMVERKSKIKGYDWLKAVSLGFTKIFKKPFFLDANNYVICSEITDMIYGDIGIDLVPNAIIGHVTPGDIASSPNIKLAFTINN